MKLFKLLFIVFLLGFGFNFVTTGSNLAYADDDDYKDYKEEYYEQYGEGHGDHHKEDGPYEEIGEMAGWGTVVVMGAAAVIFPIRRSLKTVITNFPDAKNIFISLSKFFGKYHVFLGISALALSIFHGVLMYLNEGRLESEGVTGLGSAILMTVAGILGAVLIKNKKSKSIRTTHTVLIAFAILVGVVHIASA